LDGGGADRLPAGLSLMLVVSDAAGERTDGRSVIR
jgi:hypothetical protein